MSDLESEIAAYSKVQEEMELKHMGKWVVFHNLGMAGVFDSFEEAAQDASRRFGRGPYLIRQVGASSVTLPASVMFNPGYG